MLPELTVPQLVVDEAFRLLLIFVRIGGAMVLMPGLAEAYVAPRVRLLLAHGLPSGVAECVADAARVAGRARGAR